MFKNESQDIDPESDLIALPQESRITLGGMDSRYVKAEEYIGIVSIQIDPSQLVLACSKGGQIAALTPIEQKQNYLYIELGEETFCTVGLPSVRPKEMGEVLADPNPVCCI